MKAIKVPAKLSEHIAVVEVGATWRNLAAAIGEPCQYIERVLCPLTPEYELVFVVDEDGQFNGQPDNRRAWNLYPVRGYSLKGDVLVMAEGWTENGRDFIDLPDPDKALGLVLELCGGPLW